MQHREIPLTPDAHEALLRQRKAFVEKFGREPGPDDPVFFDPDADTPQPLDLEGYEKDLADAMAAAGIDPHLIYASRKTGLLVTEENLDKLPEEALEEWNAARDELKALLDEKEKWEKWGKKSGGQATTFRWGSSGWFGAGPTPLSGLAGCRGTEPWVAASPAPRG